MITILHPVAPVIAHWLAIVVVHGHGHHHELAHMIWPFHLAHGRVR